MPGVAAELAAGRVGTGRRPAGASGTGSAVNPLVRCGVAGSCGTGRDGAPTAHNPEVEGSNPSPATNHHQGVRHIRRAPFWFSRDQMLTSADGR